MKINSWILKYDPIHYSTISKIKHNDILVMAHWICKNVVIYKTLMLATVYGSIAYRKWILYKLFALAIYSNVAALTARKFNAYKIIWYPYSVLQSTEDNGRQFADVIDKGIFANKNHFALIHILRNCIIKKLIISHHWFR